MSSRTRSSIRHCPVCGVAMQASKSREELAYFDIFQCLNCQSVIRESRPQPAAGDLNAPPAQSSNKNKR